MGGCGDCSRVLLGLASCLVGWVSLLLAPAGCLAAVVRVLRLLLVLWSWGALPRCWLRAWCWVLLWWLLLRASGFLLPCGRLRVFAACFGAPRVAAPLVSGYSAPLPLVVVRYSFGCSDPLLLGVVVVGVLLQGGRTAPSVSGCSDPLRLVVVVCWSPESSASLLSEVFVVRVARTAHQGGVLQVLLGTVRACCRSLWLFRDSAPLLLP